MGNNRQVVHRDVLLRHVSAGAENNSPGFDQRLGVRPETILLERGLLQSELSITAGHALAQKRVVLDGLLEALFRNLKEIGKRRVRQRDRGGL